MCAATGYYSVCVCVFAFVCVYLCMFVYACVCVCVYIYTHTHIYIYIYIYICVCVCVCVRVCFRDATFNALYWIREKGSHRPQRQQVSLSFPRTLCRSERWSGLVTGTVHTVSNIGSFVDCFLLCYFLLTGCMVYIVCFSIATEMVYWQHFLGVIWLMWWETAASLACILWILLLLYDSWQGVGWGWEGNNWQLGLHFVNFTPIVW